MPPSKWEIWLVNMPFEEGIGAKVRPALILDPQSVFILVGKMTSRPPRTNYPYEYPLADWQGAGLICQTTLRLSKRVRLAPAAFIRRVGVLQPVDQVNVRAMLAQIAADC